jgi:hypothetical protein
LSARFRLANRGDADDEQSEMREFISSVVRFR